MVKLPRQVTVLVDKRERVPILFPAQIVVRTDRTGPVHRLAVVTKRKEMVAGDYAILGHERACIIERKGGLGELHGNLLTVDFKRFDTAFQRLLKATDCPVLLLDLSVADMCRRSRYCADPAHTQDALFRYLERWRAKHNLHILWTGRSRSAHARRLLGEVLLRFMLVAAFPSVEIPLVTPGNLRRGRHD